MVALGFGLRKARRGAVALRLQRFDLPLGQLKSCFGARQRVLLLAQLRAVLLRVLNAARASLGQRLIARRLLLREHQRGLCLANLCLIGADLRLLCANLRIDALNTGLCVGNLCLRLIERHAVVAVVDARDDRARCHVLVVCYRHLDDIA